MTITLKPQALTSEQFAPYGDVIESVLEQSAAMNSERFERFDDLCDIDMQDDGKVVVSIARCRVATSLPLRIDSVERHPLGSQAFVPLTPCRMVIVVAPPGKSVTASDLRAFITNGRQGINYHRGTWHMPLIAFDTGREFLIIDRMGDGPNCDVHNFDETITLVGK